MSKIGIDTMPEVSKDMARKDFYVVQTYRIALDTN
mgnify:FL=1